MAMKKMSGRPKGWWMDELAKRLAKAVKAGDTKLANELRDQMRRAGEQETLAAMGKDELQRQWGSAYTAYEKTLKELETATGANRRRLESKLRGMEAKMPELGKRQQADMKGTLDAAGQRRLRREQLRQAGGKNSREQVAKRSRKRATLRETAKKAYRDSQKGKGKGGK